MIDMRKANKILTLVGMATLNKGITKCSNMKVNTISKIEAQSILAVIGRNIYLNKLK